MQQSRKKRVDWPFYLYAAAFMLPVIVQQIVASIFNFIDNFMVGTLGAASLAGVSVANKPYTVFMCLFFGLTGAGCILISQYFGAKDEKTTQQVFAVQSIGSLILGTLFFVILALFPREIMGIFVTEEATMEAGLAYLEVIKFSYIPAAISMSCAPALRSVGKSRVPMIASLIAMGVNIALNSLLIFGLCGFPRMEERGAALATVIARTAEAAFFVYLLARKKTAFSLDIACARKLPREVMHTYVQKGIPLTVNEVFWSLGQMIFFWTYSRVQESALPALSLVDQVTTIVYALTAGMASAAITIVGNTLGAGDIPGARRKANQLLRMALAISSFCAVLGFGLSFAVPAVYTSLDASLRWIATQLIFIQSICVIPSALYSTCYSILRAGGDTRSAVMLDSGYMWIAVIPTSLLCALVLPALGISDVRIAFLVVQALMNAKIIWALAIIRRGRWARNMTYGAADS